MSFGILLLRVAVALILLAHASQKTFGWFQGLGLEKQSAWFADLGLRPGRALVITAACAETLAAVSLAAGFLTPAGAALAAGTMLVAGMTMHLNAGRIWNAAGGGEYPYLLALVAVALGFIGPGRLSLDGLIASVVPGFAEFDSGAVVGVLVACVAIIGGIPFALTLRRAKRTPRDAESR